MLRLEGRCVRTNFTSFLSTVYHQHNVDLTIVTCAEYLHVLAVVVMPYMDHII